MLDKELRRRWKGARKALKPGRGKVDLGFSHLDLKGLIAPPSEAEAADAVKRLQGELNALDIQVIGYEALLKKIKKPSSKKDLTALRKELLRVHAQIAAAPTADALDARLALAAAKDEDAELRHGTKTALGVQDACARLLERAKAAREQRKQILSRYSSRAVAERK